MPRIKPLLVLCAALLTVTPAASADVNSDMNQFFNKLGFASNTTQSGVWQGQAAGYAYGGSLYARTQVKKEKYININLHFCIYSYHYRNIIDIVCTKRNLP